MKIGKYSAPALFVLVLGLVAVAQTQSQTQKPAQNPNQLDGATEDFAAAVEVSPRRAGGRRQQRDGRPRRRRESGAFRSRHLEVWPCFQCPRRTEDVEPGEAQAAAGWQGDRRDALQRHGSGHLLRHGQRRLRLIWTEMQHDQRDWDQAVAVVAHVSPRAAVPGVRVAYADEREIQHALDAGALVIVVPTVDTAEEAIEARNWTYFPPLGRRSSGGGQAFDASMWGGVPGGYRNTVNDNVVLS